ncbi:uncharacterized protein LOC133530455 [Cydia pomonella]|uniref:uncharacterized protein LOC133530455 n=1 Tax=Cydia pomonella TaxID=82600 RepID=UPI002ADE7EB3|nr:uncharacterized protein LOC133530455 [Cydia pomonella]
MENSKKQDSFFLRGKKQLNGNKFNNKVKPDENQGNNDFKGNSQNFKGKRQQKFDQNRVQKDNSDDKKPFDKKTYRLKKYSKKYKLEQWEEQRKKRLLRNLQKDLKNDEGAGTYKPKTFDEDAADGQDVTGRFVKHPDLIEKEIAEKADKEKKRPVLSARERHEKMKQDKLERQQQMQKAIEEKNQKMQEYKKKKQEKFKKLSKKTKKGQPMMTGRLELLLEKIQKNK